MADEDLLDDEIEIKPSKKPLIIAAVGALLIGAGGGFGAATFLGGGDDAAEEEGEEGEGEDEEEGDGLADAGDIGDLGPDGEPITREIVSLGKFTVNLRGGGGGRILRAEIEVETTSLHTATIEEVMAMLRDAVILLASDYTFSDLDGLDGKLRLRDELLSRLNASLEEPIVRRVYFTDFVVQ